MTPLEAMSLRATGAISERFYLQLLGYTEAQISRVEEEQP